MQATEVTGRVLEVRGDTVVAGGEPIIIPAPGTACYVAATAIFVPPPNARDIAVRRPDTAKTIWALSIAGVVVYAIDVLLHKAFPET